MIEGVDPEIVEWIEDNWGKTIDILILGRRIKSYKNICFICELEPYQLYTTSGRDTSGNYHLPMPSAYPIGNSHLHGDVCMEQW